MRRLLDEVDELCVIVRHLWHASGDFYWPGFYKHLVNTIKTSSETIKHICLWSPHPFYFEDTWSDLLTTAIVTTWHHHQHHKFMSSSQALLFTMNLLVLVGNVSRLSDGRVRPCLAWWWPPRPRLWSALISTSENHNFPPNCASCLLPSDTSGAGRGRGGVFQLSRSSCLGSHVSRYHLCLTNLTSISIFTRCLYVYISTFFL